jgi:Ca2+-binding RTX toxin-like protein
VDAGAGDPIPSSGITFDGGAGTNTLSVFTGDGNDRVTVGHTGATVTITLNADQPINLLATQNLFIQTGGGNDTVTIKDLSGTAVTGISVDLGAGNDLFNGSLSTTPLVIHAGAGTDVIAAGRGDTVIYGDTGNKTIYGGIGNEVIYGGIGTNLIVGGIGDAVIYGGIGTNTIFGGLGNAIIYGGTGTNTIYGGIGNQIIYGGNGTNTIYGGIGSQVLCGGSGKNTIYGGIGTEAIYKGTGSTTITRGIGKQTIYDAGKKPTDLVSLASSQAGSQILHAFQQPQHAWLIDFLLDSLFRGPLFRVSAEHGGDLKETGPRDHGDPRGLGMYVRVSANMERVQASYECGWFMCVDLCEKTFPKYAKTHLKMKT